jgi:pimeloyl-ACP methyl ester carboxylesterase
MTGVEERSHQVTASDGVELQAWLASPVKPEGVLLLCHGLTTDATEHGQFLALRDRALRAGLAVARFDARGHGQSGGTNEELRLAGARTDVEAALTLIDAELGDAMPMVSLGTSFGGAAAVHAAATRAATAGVVLWYAVVDYEWNFGSDSTVPATLLFRASADPSRDPEWAAMPVVNTSYYFPAALLGELRTDQTPERLAALDVPVLAYYGSRDRFVDASPLRRLALRKPDIDVRTAWGAGHGFLLWRRWIVDRTVKWARKAVTAAARP